MSCLRPLFAAFVSVFLVSSLTAQSATALETVNQMVQAEMNAVKLRQHFSYRCEERSTRTKGHLWVEGVVETSAGRMRRLISQDGKPLSPADQKTENDRIDYLVRHPDAFRRENQTRKDDESKTADLLKALPKAFLFEEAGTEGDCQRITFKPNPAFQERTYQDRVIHAVGGTLLISGTPEHRLCSLDARLLHEVDFGFGLLGKVSLGSNFSMTRTRVSPGQWKTANIAVHVDGNILLLKSVSRQEDATHSDFKQVPYDLSVVDAANLVRSLNF